MEQQHKDIELFFRKMGYTGEMPDLYQNCNRSTSHIWDQLMSNVRPKDEVQQIRRNVIIHRLQSQPLNKQDNYPYKVKEIHLYNKKVELEKKVNLLKEEVQEKEKIVKRMSKANKIQYVMIDKSKSKVKQNEVRELLLRKKCDMLEKSKSESQEILSTVKRLTPVELEENPDTAAIVETLQACAKKLEAYLKEVNVPSNNTSNFMKVSYPRSTSKQSIPGAALQTLLARSEKKAVWKRSAKKENDPNQLNVPRRILFPFGGESPLNESKEESLGIIPDSDLNNLSGMLSISSNFGAGSNTFKTPKQVGCVAPQLSSMVQQVEPLASVYQDKSVNEDLRRLLQKHNRQTIWNIFQSMEDNLSKTVMKHISEEFTNQKLESTNREDIAKIRFTHVQIEMEILTNKLRVRKLEQQVLQRKKKLIKTVSQKKSYEKKIEEFSLILDAHIEDIALDATLQFLKDQLQHAKRHEGTTKLQMLSAKIDEIKKNITMKTNSIEYYIQMMIGVLQTSSQTISSTVNCVRKLLPYIEDMSWCDVLTKQLNHSELTVFERFPLDHNRRCTFTNPTIFYRDLCTSSIPDDVEVDSETMYMLMDIIQQPFTPPKTVLLNILQAKKGMEHLEMMKSNVDIPEVEKVSVEDLEKQESYIQYALDRLHRLLTSSTSKQTLAITDVTRESMDIWLEMPFKDLYLSKKLVDGKDYMYYKKLYDSYYNNLK